MDRYVVVQVNEDRVVRYDGVQHKSGSYIQIKEVDFQESSFSRVDEKHVEQLNKEKTELLGRIADIDIILKAIANGQEKTKQTSK